MTVREFVRALGAEAREWRYWQLRGRAEALRMCELDTGFWVCPISALAKVRYGHRCSPRAGAALLGLSDEDKTRIILAADWTVRHFYSCSWWRHPAAWRHWWLRRRLLRATGAVS